MYLLGKGGMEQMKKKLAAILAGLLVLTMGTTVFAQTDGSACHAGSAFHSFLHMPGFESLYYCPPVLRNHDLFYHLIILCQCSVSQTRFHSFYLLTVTDIRIGK